MARQLEHRCAVCWERQQSHSDWHEHAITTHDARLDEFGWHVCRAEQGNGSCPGNDHARKLPNYGTERVKRAAPMPQPFTARDGTVYTPQPLPIDGGA